MKNKIQFTCIAFLFFFFSKAISTLDNPKISSASAERIKERVNSGELLISPFAFTENKGQIKGFDGSSHPEVKFSFQNQQTQIFVLQTGLAYQFKKIKYPKGYQKLLNAKSDEIDEGRLNKMQKNIRIETYRMDMQLLNANENAVITTEGDCATDHYYNLNISDVHSYKKITYHDIYPQIDWIVYIKGKEIKYDFVVKPGGDPSQIKMGFKNHEKLNINKDGSFVLKNKMGAITEKKPVSFQNDRSIATRFLLNKNELSFQIETYDKSKILIIDPSLAWSTFYGGSNAEIGRSCATDASGNVYLAGEVESSATNIASGGYQNSYGGGLADAFLVKFNSSGVRQWGTYFGGSDEERGRSCATDASGNIYLAGVAVSTVNIASGGHQNIYGGGFSDAFLAKFSTSGALLWSTYYGGGSTDRGYACATDASGNVYLGGSSASTNNIASGGHQNAWVGNYDAFLVKFNSSGVRQWGTYYGGAGDEEGFSCATDASGNVFLCGRLYGSNTNISFNGHQNSPYNLTGYEAYLVKFNSSGVRQWGTYYGDSGDEEGLSCSTDGSGNVYLAGFTTSTANIASGGHQNTFGGTIYEAFLVKFNSSGVRQWGTYYGGNDNDQAKACATDASGNVYLVGSTRSSNNIASGGYQNTIPDVNFYHYFLAKFSSAGIRQWGSYYGGTGSGEDGFFCTVDPSGAIYFGGSTTTSTVAIGGHQTSFGGILDASLIKFCEAPLLQITASNTFVCQGSSTSLTASGANTYSWNNGSTSSVISLTPAATSNYSVLGTATNGCTNTAVQSVSVNALTNLGGSVTSTVGNVTGIVILYKKTSLSGQWDSITNVPINSSAYSFNSVPSASYAVLAVPTQPDLLETYGSNSTSWQSASLISHSCITNSTENINVVPILNIGTGPGSMSGRITEGAGYGQKSADISAGNPIGGISVKGGKNPGGNVVGRVLTNSNGEYSLTGLPANSVGESYFVLVEIPGLNNNNTYSRVILAGSENYINLDFVVDSAKIDPVDLNVGVKELVLENGNLLVYPNPSNGQLNVNFKLLKTSEISVDLSDVSGLVVKTILTSFKQDKGEVSLRAQLNDINPGVYFVSIKVGEEVRVTKIVVTN